MDMSKIGFVGLGIMGTPMAGHLMVGGHELFLYDIKPVPKGHCQVDGVGPS
jgi:2-hydroxy-3-oxopropionate reductase